MKNLYACYFPARIALLASAILPALALLTGAMEQPAYANGQVIQSTARVKRVVEEKSGIGAGTYTLIPLYKTGELTRYQFTAHRTTDRKKTSDLDIIDSKFRMVMQETTLKTADGGIILEEKIERADGDFDEHEIELTAAMPKVTLTRDRKGATLVATSGGILPIQEPVSEIFQLLGRIQRSCLPPAPVQVGESWKFAWQDSSGSERNTHNNIDSGKDAKEDAKKGDGTKYDKNDGKTAGLKDSKTAGTGMLVGLETVDGQPTLKIKLDFTSVLYVPDIRKNGAIIEVTSHFIGTANLDTITYKFVRLQGASDDLLPQGEKAKTEVSLALAPATGKKSTPEK